MKLEPLLQALWKRGPVQTAESRLGRHLSGFQEESDFVTLLYSQFLK